VRNGHSSYNHCLFYRCSTKVL